MPRHADATINDGIHIVYAFSFADAATREAHSYAAEDIGKVARQTSDTTFWILTGVGPNTFAQFAAGAIVALSDLDPLMDGVAAEGTGNAASREDHVHPTDTSRAAASAITNVDNTSDADKPVSTAQQTALDLKAPLASPAFTGTPTGITKTHVGLPNVDNTADASKPVSTAQQTALDLKANIASPTFTGTVGGVTKAMVGLGNVDDESKATILASPAITGTPTGITKTHVGLGNVANVAAIPAADLVDDDNFTAASATKVPSAQSVKAYVDGAVTGGVTYVSVWNATTNTPTITSSVGTSGNYYKVSVAGSTNIDGITDWEIGDWIIFNGSTWDKIDQTETVSSVASKTGAVTLVSSDVGLGNVTNESKATMFSSPTFTGTVGGVTKAHVGLGNVDNESKATILSSPAITGTPTGITATHVGAEPAFSKNTGFNKNLGTSAGTVSEGNHTHSGLSTDHEFVVNFYGNPEANQVIFRYRASRAMSFASQGHKKDHKVGPTADPWSCSVKKNGTQVSLLNVRDAEAYICVFTAAFSLAVNDVLTIEAPGTQDATLEDLSLTLMATLT